MVVLPRPSVNLVWLKKNTSQYAMWRMATASVVGVTVTTRANELHPEVG
jgi:hypothetical protein